MKSILIIAILLPADFAVADDWPTHRRDNQRTGHANETLQLPLRLQWSRRIPTPRPAWPRPAQQDYWHRKTNLRDRIVHDKANGIVVAKGRVLVGSSSDDQVRALDVDSGELLWSAYSEGPIRLAPAVWQDFVVFGSDDGCVYAVDLDSGDLRWKTRPPEVGTRRIPGNGRIISERPIRSGVMVMEDGTGFFTAGIFPQQGAYFFSLDVRTGKILDQAVIEKSVQGYLEDRGGRVFAPTGRDPTGASFSGGSKNVQSTKKQAQLDTNTFALVSDAKQNFLGREDLVVATSQVDQELWRANVQGRVCSLAIANGQLFASTDAGWIYAFGSRESDDLPVESTTKVSELPNGDLDSDPVLNRPGYALYVDPEIKELTDWVANSDMQTVVAVQRESSARDLRSQLEEIGAYGKVVVHVHSSLDELPYADKIFHRIVGGKVEQVRRLLVPYVGFAQCEDGHVEPTSPSDSGDWTHTYGDAGNTASSQANVGSDLKLQWFGGPGPRNMVDRHMRTMPPLVSNGRMYIAGLDRVITVDAFTGTTLWEKEIPGSTRIGILKDCGWMVADEGSLFVALANQCEGFATTSTGKPVQSKLFSVPFDGRDWGYVARVGDQLIGSSTLPDAARRTINRAAILEGAYSDNRPIVCSDGIFAFDTSTDQLMWKYESSGSILNPTIASNGRFVFFLENPRMDLELTQTGRIKLAEFLTNSRAELTALDLASGKKSWSVGIPSMKDAQNAYVLCNEARVILVNSRNEETVRYDVRVFDAAGGEQLWQASQDNRRKPGGDHGEQDKHPLLVGSRLIVEPLAYDLDSGHRISELDLSQRGYGCGTISASSKALFFRSGNPASYLLDSNKIEQVTSVTRPGCWINMIPASGLLLIPEGSSGCTCNYPVQTSMAFTSE